MMQHVFFPPFPNKHAFPDVISECQADMAQVLQHTQDKEEPLTEARRGIRSLFTTHNNLLRSSNQKASIGNIVTRTTE